MIWIETELDDLERRKEEILTAIKKMDFHDYDPEREPTWNDVKCYLEFRGQYDEHTEAIISDMIDNGELYDGIGTLALPGERGRA